MPSTMQRDCPSGSRTSSGTGCSHIPDIAASAAQLIVNGIGKTAPELDRNTQLHHATWSTRAHVSPHCRHSVPLGERHRHTPSPIARPAVIRTVAPLTCPTCHSITASQYSNKTLTALLCSCSLGLSELVSGPPTAVAPIREESTLRVSLF